MKPDMKMLGQILQSKTSDLFYYLFEFLEKNGYGITCDGRKHTYYAGTCPIMLVAHLDTVHAREPKEVYYDKSQGVIWSPDGLGADDRAGVWGICEIVRRGYRPHILFTDEEETGGHGAREACKAFTPDGVHCLIEMDRKGDKDAVYYTNDNENYHKWIESFGFDHAHGSFTDISVLMPEWKLSGVNLSIGYYEQHTKMERMFVKETLATVDKVCRMLDVPPKKVVPYVAKVYQYASYTQRWVPGESAGVWKREEVKPSNLYVGGDYRGDHLGDYAARVTPEHYQRGLIPDLKKKSIDDGQYAWQCVMCQHKFRAAEEQEPSDGVCTRCLEAEILDQDDDTELDFVAMASRKSNSGFCWECGKDSETEICDLCAKEWEEFKHLREEK